MEFTKAVAISVDRDDARKYILEHANDFVDYMMESASYSCWKFLDEQNDQLAEWIRKGGLQK